MVKAMVKIGVLRYPGTNNEIETIKALRSMNAEAILIPHFEAEKIYEMDGIYIAGGFSYGDYLRPGAVVKTTETADKLKEHVSAGKPVLGVCNGFQILVELNLLPGALVKNTSTRFISKWVNTKIVAKKGFLSNLFSEILYLPIAHYSGRFYIDDEGLNRIITNKQVVLQYSNNKGEISSESNPNGSISNIAGVTNEKGNVVGMMPHPERSYQSFHRSNHGGKIIQAFLEEAKC